MSDVGEKAKVDGRSLRYRRMQACFRCGERRPVSDGGTCAQCLALVPGLMTRVSTAIKDIERALARRHTPAGEALRLATALGLLRETRAALDGQKEAVGRVLALVERGPGRPGRGC